MKMDTIRPPDLLSFKQPCCSKAFQDSPDLINGEVHGSGSRLSSLLLNGSDCASECSFCPRPLRSCCGMDQCSIGLMPERTNYAKPLAKKLALRSIECRESPVACPHEAALWPSTTSFLCGLQQRLANGALPMEDIIDAEGCLCGDEDVASEEEGDDVIKFGPKPCRSNTAPVSSDMGNVLMQPGPSCLALKCAVLSLNRMDDFVKKKIGHGFFSEVYKVTHKVTRKIMVLKVNTITSNRPNVLREVQLINKMDHPNIVRFKGVCVENGQLHSLTEYCAGGSLDQLILNLKRSFPWTLRISLALDIARGMQYVHSVGYIHRDLTSKNVLLRVESGFRLVAVVADFGLAIKIPAKIVNAITGLIRCCKLPTAGTPYFMAPECLNDEPYDEQADVFSFGIIVCEMIARIDADPDVLPRTQNFGLDYLRFSELCPEDCPMDFLQVAFRCCLMDPGSRLSFKDSIELLRQILISFYRARNLSQLSHQKCFAKDQRLMRRSQSELSFVNEDDLRLQRPSEDIELAGRSQNPNVLFSHSSMKPVSSSRQLAPNLPLVLHNIATGDPYYNPSSESVNPFYDRYRDCRKIYASRLPETGGVAAACSQSMRKSFPPNSSRVPMFAISPTSPTRRHACESRSLPSSPILSFHNGFLLHDEDLNNLAEDLSPLMVDSLDFLDNHFVCSSATAASSSARKRSLCGTNHLGSPCNASAMSDEERSEAENEATVRRLNYSAEQCLDEEFAGRLTLTDGPSPNSVFRSSRILTLKEFSENDNRFVQKRRKSRGSSFEDGLNDASYASSSSGDEATHRRRPNSSNSRTPRKRLNCSFEAVDAADDGCDDAGELPIADGEEPGHSPEAVCNFVSSGDLKCLPNGSADSGFAETLLPPRPSEGCTERAFSANGSCVNAEKTEPEDLVEQKCVDSSASVWEGKENPGTYCNKKLPDGCCLL